MAIIPVGQTANLSLLTSCRLFIPFRRILVLMKQDAFGLLQRRYLVKNTRQRLHDLFTPGGLGLRQYLQKPRDPVQSFSSVEGDPFGVHAVVPAC